MRHRNAGLRLPNFVRREFDSLFRLTFTLFIDFLIATSWLCFVAWFSWITHVLFPELNWVIAIIEFVHQANIVFVALFLTIWRLRHFISERWIHSDASTKVRRSRLTPSARKPVGRCQFCARFRKESIDRN